MELDQFTVSLDLLKQLAPGATLATAADRQIIAEQLGRDPRGLLGVAWRCVCGRPGVTITAPRLPDGTPFPTTFYLCLPSAVLEVSRIEARGEMAEMNTALQSDPEAMAEYERAHREYVRRRELLGSVPEIDGVSAGGMPTRIKCLHALVGYSLAAGPGVCAQGDAVVARLNLNECRCGGE